MQRRDLIVVITIFKIFSLKILLKKLYNILKNFANLKQKRFIDNKKFHFALRKIRLLDYRVCTSSNFISDCFRNLAFVRAYILRV